MHRRFCHIFEACGNWHLFDVNSAAVCQISAVSARIMKSTGDKAGAIGLLKADYPESEIAEAWDQLQATGLLTQIEPKPRAEPKLSENVPVTSIALHVVHDCNLRCRYCYAKDGTYNGPKGAMPLGTAVKALEFLFSQDADNFFVGFFGGEPLLQFGLIKELVPKARAMAEQMGKKVRFSIETNGVLLDAEKAGYLIDNQVSIGTSIDGPREWHDQLRPDPSGRGSYQRVVDNILPWLGKYNRQIIARLTIPGPEIRMAECVKHVMDLGFQNVGWNYVKEQSSPLSIKMEHLGEISRQTYELADMFVELVQSGRLPSLGNLGEKVENLYNRQLKERYCSAAWGSLSVAPDGSVYPCHRLTGRLELKLGTIDNVQPDKISDFQQAFARRLRGCRGCWAKLCCQGGCPYQSIQAGKSMEELDEVYCRLVKLSWESAIYTICRLQKKGITSYNAGLENLWQERTV